MVIPGAIVSLKMHVFAWRAFEPRFVTSLFSTLSSRPPLSQVLDRYSTTLTYIPDDILPLSADASITPPRQISRQPLDDADDLDDTAYRYHPDCVTGLLDHAHRSLSVPVALLVLPFPFVICFHFVLLEARSSQLAAHVAVTRHCHRQSPSQHHDIDITSAYQSINRQ